MKYFSPHGLKRKSSKGPCPTATQTSRERFFRFLAPSSATTSRPVFPPPPLVAAEDLSLRHVRPRASRSVRRPPVLQVRLRPRPRRARLVLRAELQLARPARPCPARSSRGQRHGRPHFSPRPRASSSLSPCSPFLLRTDREGPLMLWILTRFDITLSWWVLCCWCHRWLYSYTK